MQDLKKKQSQFETILVVDDTLIVGTGLKTHGGVLSISTSFVLE
jgi:hypothetical protein